MKEIKQIFVKNRVKVAILIAVSISLLALLFYRLGTLTAGVSPGELAVANTPIGWTGIYNQPFYLPLDIGRSIIFFVFEDAGALLLRSTNAILGLLTVASFAYVINRWHGTRTAIFGTVLFASSAWFLHVSRLASNDVLYLLAIPLLLATGVALSRNNAKPLVYYGSAFLWGLLLYVPGLIWLIALTIFWQRKYIKSGWKHFSKLWQRGLYVFVGLFWLPLLVNHLIRSSNVLTWIGAPEQFDAPLVMIKDFLAVFVHLFVRGPQYPELWLGQLPILSIFTLVSCVVGIYFYAKNLKALRTRQIISYFAVGTVLIALNGAVGLSLLVSLMYILAATGVAYLLREWLKVFPNNPLARSLGIAIICVAVGLSAIYGIRSYFVAWPNNTTTEAIFRYDPTKQ